MSLTDFRPEFDNSYQDTFLKTLVSKEIMNTRFEPTLKFGASVERVAFDTSGIVVRDVTRGADSTIDTISDSSELLTINLEKEAVFRISDGEVTQAGPLNPGENIGQDVAHKVAQDLDFKCFAEVRNAANTFDSGDLTSLVSTGTPITLSATTVPQMTTRMAAKLRRKENQEVSMNMALVVDSYAAADIEQYLMGKDIDIAGSVFKNGYAGVVRNAVMYISENLTGEVTQVVDVATADEVVTILGVTFTAKATPATAGEFDIAGSADAQGAIMANMINGAATGQDTAAGYYEVSAADRAILTEAGVVATYVDATDTLTITGAGRLEFTTDMSGAVVEWLNCYFGKKGAIDLVVQDLSPVDMRTESRQRATVVFSSYLAGIKTFADGAKKFVQVKIAV